MTSAEEWQRRLIALVNAQINRRAQSTETALRQEAGRIATGTVSSATINLSQLAQGGATANQVLAWNSGASEWQPATNSATLPWTSAGDILYYDGSVAQRLAIGAAGQALVVNAGATSPEWDTVLTNPMTTAEDIIVGGASGAPARLGVGSNGDVLTVSGGSVGWAAPSGGGGLVLISSQTLASAATNIDFSSIPSTYTHLRVVMQGQLDANIVDPVFLYFNADYTDTNYQSRYELSVTNSATISPRIGVWSGGTRAGGSTFANDLDIRIPFYSNTSLVKRAWSEINYYDSNQSGDLVIGRGYVFHSSAANTNAVSAIRLSAGTNQFISGTVAELYGVL
jgi:hypothetical protein